MMIQPKERLSEIQSFCRPPFNSTAASRRVFC